MVEKNWYGAGQTDGAPATTANSQGTGGPNDTLTIAFGTGGGSASYSALNPLIAGHLSLRLQAQAIANARAQAYMAFTDTDIVSLRYAFRIRQDPGFATTLLRWVITGGTQGVGGLHLKSVSGSRQLYLTNGAAEEVINFGAITFGAGVDDIYVVDVPVSRGTTLEDVNGVQHCRLYDYQGNLLGEYPLNTTANMGTAQFVRTTWGMNTAVLSDYEIMEIKVVTDPPLRMLGIPMVSPADPPILNDPLVMGDKYLIRASAAAGDGGTLSYSVTPTPALQIGDNAFLMNRNPSTGEDYDALVTVTESPSGKTANKTVTVPKLPAGGVKHMPRHPNNFVPGGTSWR